MMKKFRIAAVVLLSLTLCLSAVVLTAGAQEMVAVVDESFDDYDVDVNGSATGLKDAFILDANAIGDGYIKVCEDDRGNLYLQSHVFTQVYLREALTSSYIFSLTSNEMQGGHQAGVFLRAPANKAAYYEGDGGDPERTASEGLTGIWVYASYDSLDINIKSYGADKTNKVQNNTYAFALPEGSHCGQGSSLDLRFEDDGASLTVYADDQLVCTLRFGEVGGKWSDLGVTVACFQTVTLLDANGTECMTVENPYVSANESIVGWATRVANMSVDNVKISIPASEVPTEAPTEAPTDPVENLTTEPEQSSEAGTEAPADPGAGEQTVTETAAGEGTEPATETAAQAATGDGTEAVTDAVTEAETVTEIVDDSLAVWILVAVMLVAIGVSAGILVAKKKAEGDHQP
jgi:hypothetical protein